MDGRKKEEDLVWRWLEDSLVFPMPYMKPMCRWAGAARFLLSNRNCCADYVETRRVCLSASFCSVLKVVKGGVKDEWRRKAETVPVEAVQVKDQ